MFALVIGGSEMEIGLGNFDVVAENLIEADFEGIDAGALAFALFHGGDDLFAVFADIAKLIEFGVIAGADHAGFAGGGGRLVGEGAFEFFADVGEFVDFLVEFAEEITAAGLGRGDEVS